MKTVGIDKFFYFTARSERDRSYKDEQRKTRAPGRLISSGSLTQNMSGDGDAVE